MDGDTGREDAAGAAADTGVRIEDVFDDAQSRYESGLLFRSAHAGVGFTPGGVSRWMRRRQYVVFAVIAAVVFLVGTALFFAIIVTMATLAWLVLVAVFMPLSAVGLGVAFLGRARLRERAAAEAAAMHACPNCLHDLSAQKVPCCSECGQRVIYDALPVLWENAGWRRTLAGRVDATTGFGMGGLSRWELRWQRRVIVAGVALPLLISALSPLSSVGLWIVGGVFREWNLTSVFAGSLVGLLPFFMVFFVLMLRSRRRVIGALRASGGVCCPRCLRDLSDAAVERCPACQQAVDYGTLRESWEPRLKFYRIESVERGS